MSKLFANHVTLNHNLIRLPKVISDNETTFTLVSISLIIALDTPHSSHKQHPKNYPLRCMIITFMFHSSIKEASYHQTIQLQFNIRVTHSLFLLQNGLRLRKSSYPRIARDI